MKRFDILLVCVVFLLLSCEKDENTGTEPDSQPPQKNTHRIKQLIWDSPNEMNDYKYQFSYDDEKLIEWKMFDKDQSGNWVLDREVEYSYNNDIVSSIGSRNTQTGWEMFIKVDYRIQNNKLIEEAYYDYVNDSWSLSFKFIYDYSGNNLVAIREECQTDNNSSLIQCYKGDYIYNNGKVAEYQGFQLDELNDWVQTHKTTFTHIDGKLKYWIHYEENGLDNFEMDTKGEYDYSGEQISEYNRYMWNSEMNQWEYDPTEAMFFTFNDEGYLVKREEYNNNRVAIYEYEEGHGNAQLLWDEAESFLVYQLPSLKSSGNARPDLYNPISTKIFWK